MVSNLIYASSRGRDCDDGEISNILESAKRNNPGLDITGVLLYTNKKFIQYLEGDKDQIMGLYNRIKEDQRHKNVVLITLSRTEERLFPTWAMIGKGLDDNLEFRTAMSTEDRQIYEDILEGREQENSHKAVRLIQKLFGTKVAA